jgi:hypothetical protein
MAVGAAIGAAIIGAGTAIWGGEQQRRASSAQQEALNAQTLQGRIALNNQEEQRRLNVINNLEENTFSLLSTENQEARYREQLKFLGITRALAGQKYAVEKEIFEWQLATLDWEKGFKDQQAALIAERGVLARSVFGIETAKLLARERSRMAAAGVEIGTGTPLEQLWALAGERQYLSDIMKFETDVDVWSTNVEGAKLLNQKNQVRFSNLLNDIAYQGTLAENDFNVKLTKGSLALSNEYKNLLMNQRGRIGMGSTIALNTYMGNMNALTTNYNLGSSIYSQSMSNAVTGGYLNAGASIFNAFNPIIKKMFE